MNADDFNARYQVGTLVFAYPGARPEDYPQATRLVTKTRSRASVLGGHTDVVWVDGHSACIALTHVDVVTGAEYEAALLEDAVAEQGALPVPVVPEPPASGGYLPAFPWASLMDDDDLAEFLNELAEAAIRCLNPREALAEVERACGTWRLIAEAQHGHNTAPGPDAEEYVAPAPSCTRCYGADAARFVAKGGAVSPCRVCGTDATAGPSADKLTAVFVPVASLREPEGEHYPFAHHDYRVSHDLPETGGEGA
ncbi:hypothetical protein QA860_08000 [Streptomyces stelliscabiei]|uniref:hypothetical protein n=1 Tax=Streptomyces stelliscabiei TaxID=146820 RepID=UPI002FF2547A